jgi:hypothetical protein
MKAVQVTAPRRRRVARAAPSCRVERRPSGFGAHARLVGRSDRGEVVGMIPSRRSPQVVGSKREWVETLRCRARTGAAAGAASRGRVRRSLESLDALLLRAPRFRRHLNGGGWTGQTGTLRRRGRSRRWKPPAGQRPQCSPAWRVRCPTGGRRARRPEARTERSEPDRGPRPAPCETHALRAGPQGGVEVADRTGPLHPASDRVVQFRVGARRPWRRRAATRTCPGRGPRATAVRPLMTQNKDRSGGRRVK